MPERLADLQRAFVEALYDPERPAPAGLAEDRFEIYRANLHQGLAGALEEVFEVTATVLGPAFSTYARIHIAERPLTAGDRTGYGAAFAGLLAQHPALADHRFIADLAAFEWAMHHAHHAVDASPLGFGDLLDPAQTLALHPSATITRPAFQVAPLHKALLEGTTPGELERAPGGGARIIWRTPDDEVAHAALSKVDLHFLTLIHDVGGLAAAAPAADEARREDLQTLLAWCVPAGLLAAGRGEPVRPT